MAKKYLLYIHDERFGLEKEKSALINELLSQHYDGPRTQFKELHKGTPKQSPKEEVCPGHSIRINCGRKNCKY